MNRSQFETAVANEEAALRAETGARCGTCGRICDPWADSDEGYSHCCNDRIEYEDEWKTDNYSIRNWAVDNVFSRAVSAGAEYEKLLAIAQSLQITD